MKNFVRHILNQIWSNVDFNHKVVVLVYPNVYICKIHSFPFSAQERERDANLEREIDIGCCVHCAFCIENSNFEFKRPGPGQRQENNLYSKHRNELFSKSSF